MKHKIIIFLSLTFGFGLGYFINKYNENTKTIIISDKTYKFLSEEFGYASWLLYDLKENKPTNYKNYFDTILSKTTSYYPIDVSQNNFKVLVLPKRYDNNVMHAFTNYSNEVYMVTKDKIFYLKPILVKVNNELDK